MSKRESGGPRPPEANNWRELLTDGPVKNLLEESERLRTKLAIHANRQDRLGRKSSFNPLEKIYSRLALQLMSTSGKNEAEKRALHAAREVLVECKNEIKRLK